MNRPLLLVDVDGVLNPFAAKPTRRPEGYETHRLSPGGQTYRVWLNPEHGPMLLAFAEETGVELVWCTTWEHDANKMIAPLIGLPELPVVEFGYRAHEWKFSGVYPYAGDRPVAWLDDDFDHFFSEREWFLHKRQGRKTLLHHVKPSIGLTHADLDAVREWLTTVDPSDEWSLPKPNAAPWLDVVKP